MTNIDAGSQPAALVTRGFTRASIRAASAVPAATLQRRRPILIEVALTVIAVAGSSVRVLPTTIISVLGVAALALATADRAAATASTVVSTRGLIGP